MPRWPSISLIMPTCSRPARSSCRAPRRSSRTTRISASPTSAIEAEKMEQFLQQVASGLANGAIYACVALALVMIYVSTDHINFAQGEMAMFSTYISWQLMSWGLSFWFAFIVAVALSFVLGVVIERVILRPLHNAPVLSIVVVFIGLLAIFNSVSGAIWSYLIKEYPSPFPKSSFGI